MISFFSGFSSLLLFFGASAWAATTMTQGIRATHPLGVYLAYGGGEPFPALWGVNLADHATDYLRFEAAIGTESGWGVRATTFGLGTRLFVPYWALSPSIGLHWSKDVLSSGNGVVMRGISRGGDRFYTTLGVDYQTDPGIDLGFGVAQALSAAGGGAGFVHAGFFF